MPRASTRGTRALHVQGSIYAYEPGVWELRVVFGDDVVAGDVVAVIHHPETPLMPPAKVTSPYSDIVLCQRAMAQVVRGDAVLQIAADAEYGRDESAAGDFGCIGPSGNCGHRFASRRVAGSTAQDQMRFAGGLEDAG